MEDKQFDEAIHSFRRTLELSPQFSKVYQLLGQCLTSAGQMEEAVVTLQQGFAVADERGDNMPRDEMSRLLVQLGQPAPVSTKAAPARATPDHSGPGTGFRCARTLCVAGGHARQLAAPPMNDSIGRKIHETICADCWNDWVKNQSIKVINELRLDLSTERGTEEYDRYMKEFFGLE
jgi:Fe-S cluster biosynthesis and repair protein YggX